MRPSGFRSAVQVLGRRPRPAWPWVRWWTVPLPAVQRAAAACPHDPCRSRGVSTSPGGPDDRCPQSRATCPPVRTLGVRRPVLVDQLRAGAERGGRSPCWDGDRGEASTVSAAAGLCPPRDPAARAVSGWLGNRTPPQRPLSAAASGTAAGCPDGVVHPDTAARATGSHCPVGVRWLGAATAGPPG